MLGRLARLMYRRRWLVVAAWLLVLLIASQGAARVGQVLGPGDFVQPGSDSQLASQVLSQKFHQDDQQSLLVLVTSPRLTAKDAAFRRAVAQVARRIRMDAALRPVSVDNPLVSGNRQLIARDGHGAAIMVASSLKEAQIEAQVDRLRALVRLPGFDTSVAGTPAANHDYTLEASRDLTRGEMITIPILVVILLLVFGSAVAALLPLVLALFSIMVSLALVYLLGHAFDTSIYVENVVTFLGLGIAIDYSLFIVYRFREELERAGGDVERAVVRTMETTGRAVLFSGTTVAIGLSSLILTRLSFMISMGLGGLLVPVASVVAALTLLPAVLSILGGRVNAVRLLPARFLRPGESGAWHALATTIMRRPFVTGGIALLAMLALAAPATQLAFSFGSIKNADHALESVKAYLYIRQHFATTPDPTQIVVVRQGAGTVLTAGQIQGMRKLEQALRRDPEAEHVIGAPDALLTQGLPAPAARAFRGRYISADEKAALIEVIPRHEIGTKSVEQMVRRIRRLVVPYQRGALAGDAVHVGGSQAAFTDWDDAMYARFPLIVGVVLLLTYVFLFFAFRSLFLPLKAVLLNLLSVGASYGVLQLVFMRGVGSSLLGFSPESGVAAWVPVFLFAFLFGLSMDYEVFLLSRIRERWLQTGDNAGSVAYGLEKTGRLISSAAAIMVIAFSGFLIGHEIQLKEFALGMLVSVALDATLIRVVLVPSIMAIVGEWNWWVPGFMREFAHGGIPLEKEEEAEPELVGV